MASNVSNSVLAIIASFSNSLDLFGRLRSRRKKRTRAVVLRQPAVHQTTTTDEDALLASLRCGPEAIAREYQRSIQAGGEHVATGDSTAQSALAQILLRFNTGLVGIISAFLQPRHHEEGPLQHLDYSSLTALSEASRVETCRALRQLQGRLSQLSLPLSSSSSSHTVPRESGKWRRKHKRLDGPVLARVVIKDSSKPPLIAMVKPGTRRKASGASASSSSTNLSKSSRATTPPPRYQPVLEAPPATKAATADVRPAPRYQPQPQPQPQTLPSPKPAPMDAKPPRRLHLADSRSNLPSSLHPKPSPQPLLPIPHHQPRKLTPTYYSFASDSTKLGEIPLHKWSTPFDFAAMEAMNRDAEVNGWPGGGGGGRGTGEVRRGMFARWFGRRKGSQS